GGAQVAMVSYEFWQAQMGGRTPLGSIRVGRDLTPVVGVLPAAFVFVTPADLYVPHERGPGTCRTCRNYMVVARLKPPTTLDGARAEMTALSRAMLASYGTETRAVDVELRPLK